MLTHRHAALVAVLMAAILFGSTGTAQELGPAGTTPAGVGAVRLVVGALGLWLLAGERPRWSAVRPVAGVLLVGGAGVALYQPAFFTATDRLGVALGTIVALGSAPAFAGVFEAMAGRPPSRRWLIGTAVSIAGGALLVGSRSASGQLDPIGLVGALGAGMGYAAYALATKHAIECGVRPVVASGWQFSIGAVALAPLLVTEPVDWIATPGGAALALHLGLACTTIAYLLYGWGLRRITTSTATSLTLAEPATAAVLAVVVLDERLAPIAWLGIVIIAAGLALVTSGDSPQT